MIEVTERAAEGLRRMTAAARRFDPSAGIRLAPGKDGAPSFGLAAAPEQGDATIEGEGFVLFVAAGLEGTVDLGDHDVLVLRPGPAS